jgi:hypothetical protein
MRSPFLPIFISVVKSERCPGLPEFASLRLWVSELTAAGEALAGLGSDEVAEFQLHEDDGDFVGGEAGGVDEVIDRLVVAVESFEDGVFVVAEVEVGFGRAGFFVFWG